MVADNKRRETCETRKGKQPETRPETRPEAPKMGNKCRKTWETHGMEGERDPARDTQAAAKVLREKIAEDKIAGKPSGAKQEDGRQSGGRQGDDGKQGDDERQDNGQVAKTR